MAKNKNRSHKGRIRQIPIYFGKLMRMFYYMDDWKVIPMAALIAGLVAFVACQNMFKTQEGTMTGSLALTCICIWNGFFNSIQVVCRERDIVKREHRSGMHISSYLISHMLYQMIICLLQTMVTIVVCKYANMAFPTLGVVSKYFVIDLAITIFLITYSADVISLCLSCIAHNTTAAMTLMPFMLIFELLFSGNVFSLGERIQGFTALSIAKWGMNSFNIMSDYNSLPMVTAWNQLLKFKNYEVEGQKPVLMIAQYIEQNDMRDDFLLFCGKNNAIPDIERLADNLIGCWLNLIIFIAVFFIIALAILERIDKDKR